MNIILASILAAAVIAAGCLNAGDGGTGVTPNNNSVEAECVSDSDCSRAGCSGQLCVQAGKAANIITTCEYKAEYDCLRLTSCGCIEGRCAWSATGEYEACIEKTKQAKV